MDTFVLSVVCFWLAASLAIVVVVALFRIATGTVRDVDRAFCGILAGMFVLSLLFVAAGYTVSNKGRSFVRLMPSTTPAALSPRHMG